MLWETLAAYSGGILSICCRSVGAYRAGAIFGMNRFTFAAAMKLQDSDGNFIWQPTWNLTDRI